MFLTPLGVPVFLNYYTGCVIVMAHPFSVFAKKAVPLQRNRKKIARDGTSET